MNTSATMTDDYLADIPLEFQPLIRGAVLRLAEQFEGVFGRETVERFVAESIADLDGAKVRNFIPLFAERFARDRLWALAKSEGKIESDRPVVLFLCVHNAGRSQMAAGLLAHLAGEGVIVMTGGSEPGKQVNPHAVTAMQERGIDISQSFPKPWTDEIVKAADVVVTMGCGDACPVYPGKRYEDWVLEDPAGRGLEDVRAIRDEIEGKVRGLMASLEVEPVR